MAGRRQIAILGGGMGALSAALELTRTASDRARNEVTVYQMGWRLGGKGASGRRAERHGRVEEHGLHVWLGFYENTFGLLREALEELGWPSWEARFKPLRRLTLTERTGAGGRDWPMHFVPNTLVPGDLALGRGPHPGERLAVLASTLIRNALANADMVRDPDRRRVVMGLVSAVTRGLLQPGGRGLEADRLDLREWLRRGGATESLVFSPPVEAIYGLVFAGPPGSPTGETAAWTTLSAVGRLLHAYAGHVGYRLRGGMGDVAFVPVYEVLRRRGVRFRFFHRVTAVRAHDRRVTHIDLVEQVQAADYVPLVGDGAEAYWPAEPRWDHLPMSARAEWGHSPESLERTATAPTGAPRVLEHGVHFDAVVLGLPLDVVRATCPDFARLDERWRAMFDNLRSTATLAAQLWHRDPPPEDVGVKMGLARPFESVGDQRQILDAEDWGEGGPRGLEYLVGAVAQTQDGRDHIATAYAASEALDEWLRARPDHEAVLAGLRDRYVRVNADPADRYVLSGPGTTRFRLAPEASGFDNLVMAGDWTRTGINGGSVEAAAMSGRRAGLALAGRPVCVPGDPGEQSGPLARWIGGGAS